jgi:SagB-type dehydrogenase family enzyme
MAQEKPLTPIDEIFVAAPECEPSLAEWYHENTKLSPLAEPKQIKAGKPASPAEVSLQAAIAEREDFIARHNKRYPTASCIHLPPPRDLSFVDLQSVLKRRRSALAFDSRRAIRLVDLATLLHYTYGRSTGGRVSGGIRRFVPSSGALFPLEFYVLATRVCGLSADTLFHYQYRNHQLEVIGSCDPKRTPGSLLAQEAMAEAAAIIFVSGCLPRISWKYGERAYRYILLEAGHAAQNICLTAAAINVAACPVAGYYDDAVHDLLWLDGVSEVVLYALCIGKEHRRQR